MKKLIVLFSLLLSTQLFAQTGQEKLKIFYDCQTNCHETYMKQNLPAVEFVRDRNFADVHIQITSETNASGGETFHLNFMGQNNFKDVQEKYDFPTNKDMTQDQIREKMLKFLKIGLFRFWMKNGLSERLSVRINKDQVKKTEIDPWNNWIFKIGANGWFNGDSNSKNSSINGFVTAKQVKEKYKFFFKFRYYLNQQTYKYNNKEIKSERESYRADISEVLSINQHWSYGFFSRFDRSKYSNYSLSGELFGGLEYSIFPYKESSKRSLVFTTKLGTRYNKYFEKTVYNKTKEQLWRAKFFINGNLVQKWGSLYASFDYRTYLHDIHLNSFGFGAGANIRIVKGLNFNMNGYYSINHDQINIAAGNLSLEEILLTQKQLQSGYNYYFSIGLSYSFGSIYNSIVNPRFNAEGQGRTCICF